MARPTSTTENSSWHMTKAEIAARQETEEKMLVSRSLKKPALIRRDKAASRHWARIIKDMEGLEILDVLDTDTLGIYCAKMARRDDLQERYLEWRERHKADPQPEDLKVLTGMSAELQSIEREILSYAGKLGLTPESRARLAKRFAEQEEDDPDGDLFA